MRTDPLKKTVEAAVDKWADGVNAELLLERGAVATLVELIMAELKAAGRHLGTERPRRSKWHEQARAAGFAEPAEVASGRKGVERYMGS
jgi:hypothetical protein